ncbi:hypothetical protein OBBRIDRAFT_545573 [Obba rivulosa]|uniref:Uncharacterized protein n=1 Tax=Obba rivulosa TaxID=1052685 RepID=A0A8E2AXW6_9APHY|nr:hypothetical protein OBBRIDRAFT_545573 [Obba rivulosa]
MTKRKTRNSLHSGSADRRRRLPGGSEVNYPQWGQRGLITPPPAERVYDTVIDLDAPQPDPPRLLPTAAPSPTTSTTVNEHVSQSTIPAQQLRAQFVSKRRPLAPSLDSFRVSGPLAPTILATADDHSFDPLLRNAVPQGLLTPFIESAAWDSYQSDASYSGLGRAPDTSSSGSHVQGSQLQPPAIPYWSRPVRPGTSTSSASDQSFTHTPIASPAVSSDSGLSAWSTPSSMSHGRRSSQVRDIVPIDIRAYPTHSSATAPAPTYPLAYVPPLVEHPVRHGFPEDFTRPYTMFTNFRPSVPVNYTPRSYDQGVETTHHVEPAWGLHAQSSHAVQFDVPLAEATDLNTTASYMQDVAFKYPRPSPEIPRHSVEFSSAGASPSSTWPHLPVQTHATYAFEQAGAGLGAGPSEGLGSLNGTYQALGLEASRTIERAFGLEFDDDYTNPAMQTVSPDEWSRFVAHLNDIEAARTLGRDQYMKGGYTR